MKTPGKGANSEVCRAVRGFGPLLGRSIEKSCATCTYVETQGSWFEDGHLRGSSREQRTGRTAEWWSKHNNWKLTPPPRR